MSLLAHIVDWLVPFICGGVATVLGLMWRWGKAMVNGLRELLLCQLEDLRREMVIEHDGVADEDLKSRSQRLYDSYHSLGGNGHGTSLNNDIQSAPDSATTSPDPTTRGATKPISHPQRKRGKPWSTILKTSSQALAAGRASPGRCTGNNHRIQ